MHLAVGCHSYCHLLYAYASQARSHTFKVFTELQPNKSMIVKLLPLYHLYNILIVFLLSYQRTQLCFE